MELEAVLVVELAYTNQFIVCDRALLAHRLRFYSAFHTVDLQFALDESVLFEVEAFLPKGVCGDEVLPVPVGELLDQYPPEIFHPAFGLLLV